MRLFSNILPSLSGKFEPLEEMAVDGTNRLARIPAKAGTQTFSPLHVVACARVFMYSAIFRTNELLSF